MNEFVGENYKYSDLTEAIIKAFYTVYNKLGYGFLEKVYENALLVELVKSNLECEAQFQIDVYYDKTKVGYYFAGIIVDETVIVEIKAAEKLCDEHEA